MMRAEDTGEEGQEKESMPARTRISRYEKNSNGCETETKKYEKETDFYAVDELGIEPRTFRIHSSMLSERSTN